MSGNERNINKGMSVSSASPPRPGRLLGWRITADWVAYGYVALLFLMPDDVFRITSLWTFVSPPDINYHWNDFSFSVLYLPLFCMGLYYYFSRKRLMQSRILLFILFLVLKDILLVCFGDSYILDNCSFEWYLQFFVASCALFVVFALDEEKGDVPLFVYITLALTLATLLASVLMHNTPGVYDYVNRFSSTNMAHGETSFLLAVGMIVALADGRVKHRVLLVAICLAGIIATGTRKDMVFLAATLVLNLCVRVKKGELLGKLKKETVRRRSHLEILLSIALAFAVVLVVVALSGKLAEIVNIERFTDLLSGLLGKGESGLSSDSSMQGRLGSLASGLAVLKDHWLFGLNFSFFDLQYNMQQSGYPTFPHFTWLFCWLIMGIAVVVPIGMLIKATGILARYNDPFAYVGLYMLLYFAVSGGAWWSFKVLLFIMYLFWLLLRRSRMYSSLPHSVRSSAREKITR